MKNFHKSFFSKIGFILLVYSILHNFSSSLIALGLRTVNPELLENSIVYNLVALLPTYLIAFPVVWLLLGKLVPPYEFKKHKMKAGQWILAFMMVYGIGIAINIICNIVYFVIRLFRSSFLESNAIMELMTDMNPFFMVLIIGIVAPVVEEIVFRKMLVDRLIPYGEAISILVPGIIFGIFHGNLQQCFFAAAIGIFFSFIYVKTGKIKYTVFMHIGINMFSCIYTILLSVILSTGIYDNPELFSDSRYIAEYMPTILGKIIIPYLILFGMMIISFGIAISGIVLFFVFLKRFKCTKSPIISLEKGRVFSTVVLNPGMLCFGIFWIVIFVINTIL